MKEWCNLTYILQHQRQNCSIRTESHPELSLPQHHFLTCRSWILHTHCTWILAKSLSWTKAIKPPYSLHNYQSFLRKAEMCTAVASLRQMMSHLPSKHWQPSMTKFVFWTPFIKRSESCNIWSGIKGKATSGICDSLDWSRWFLA